MKFFNIYFVDFLKGLKVGASLALAIALHNIPEGVAVALPIFFATGNKKKALLYATLSGFAEPLGVIAVALFFPDPKTISPEFIEGMLGGGLDFLFEECT